MTIGQKVTHKTLGTGTVVGIREKAGYHGKVRTYVTVKFDKNLGDLYRENDNSAVFYEEAFADERYFLN